MAQIENAKMEDKTILVLGGNGFIGRHIVAKLKDAGATILIGTRAEASLNPYERRLRLQEMLDRDQWIEALAGIDVVVNAVGILRERMGACFDDIHHLAVKALAEACADLGIKLVHISALGLHDGLRAEFSISKIKGEQGIVQSGADWHLIRASLVEGEGGYGANWFKKLARWPVHFIPEKHALISPVDVSIVAERVFYLLAIDTERVPSYHRIHEVSNGVDYLLPDYLVALNGGRTRPRINIPDRVVRFVTTLCDRLNLTPLTYGHYELLTYDNCPERGAKR